MTEFQPKTEGRVTSPGRQVSPLKRYTDLLRELRNYTGKPCGLPARIYIMLQIRITLPSDLCGLQCSIESSARTHDSFELLGIG